MWGLGNINDESVSKWQKVENPIEIINFITSTCSVAKVLRQGHSVLIFCIGSLIESAFRFSSVKSIFCISQYEEFCYFLLHFCIQFTFSKQFSISVERYIAKKYRIFPRNVVQSANSSR